MASRKRLRQKWSQKTSKGLGDESTEMKTNATKMHAGIRGYTKAVWGWLRLSSKLLVEFDFHHKLESDYLAHTDSQI